MPANKISVYNFLACIICLFLTLFCSYYLTNAFQFTILPLEQVPKQFKQEVNMKKVKNIKKRLHPYPFLLWISCISPKEPAFGIEFYIKAIPYLHDYEIINWERTHLPHLLDLKKKGIEIAEQKIIKLMRQRTDFWVYLDQGGDSIRWWKIINRETNIWADFLHRY